MVNDHGIGQKEGKPVRDRQRLESVWDWLEPGLSFEYSAFRQFLRKKKCQFQEDNNEIKFRKSARNCEKTKK